MKPNYSALVGIALLASTQLALASTVSGNGSYSFGSISGVFSFTNLTLGLDGVDQSATTGITYSFSDSYIPNAVVNSCALFAGTSFSELFCKISSTSSTHSEFLYIQPPTDWGGSSNQLSVEVVQYDGIGGTSDQKFLGGTYTATVTSVPEPGSLSLLGAAGIALLLTSAFVNKNLPVAE